MTAEAVETTLAGALAALRSVPAPTAQERHEIACRLLGGYLARSPAGQPSLIIPLGKGPGSVGRVSGTVSLEFRPVAYEYQGRSWQAPSALIECRDENLIATFCALALSVCQTAWAARRPGTEAPSPRAVSQALFEWERLLRSRRLLSGEEELGLWGELSFVERSPGPEAMLLAWRGPLGELVDFHGNGIAFENKTSTKRLRHHFSQTQLVRPVGDSDTYFVSMWVAIDDVAGESLPDLVDRLSRELANSAQLEEKLLAAGYSRLDRAAYSRKLVLLEPPLYFKPEFIPKVQRWDPGVDEIRYVAQLEDWNALPAAEAERLTRLLCSPPGKP